MANNMTLNLTENLTDFLDTYDNIEPVDDCLTRISYHRDLTQFTAVTVSVVVAYILISLLAFTM